MRLDCVLRAGGHLVPCKGLRGAYVAFRLLEAPRRFLEPSTGYRYSNSPQSTTPPAHPTTFSLPSSMSCE